MFTSLLTAGKKYIKKMRKNEAGVGLGGGGGGGGEGGFKCCRTKTSVVLDYKITLPTSLKIQIL